MSNQQIQPEMQEDSHYNGFIEKVSRVVSELKQELARVVLPDPPRTDTPMDEVFDLINNERRRYVVDILDQESPVSLNELSKRVASRELGKSVDDVRHDERKRVYVALYQAHLQQMDDLGVVDYDRDAGVIARGREFDSVNWVIQRAREAVIGGSSNESA